MYKSIQQFIEKDITKIENFTEKMISGENSPDDLASELYNMLMNLGRNIQTEIYECIDTEIRNSMTRKIHWDIEKKEEPKTILDIMGEVKFKRTGYCDKKTGKYIYLLDQILGYDKGQKISLGVAAKALEETLESSYRKGGEKASHIETLSKQTVKNLVHKTVIDFPLQKTNEKKKIKNLHIVADEDHVAAQFFNKPGDLQKDENRNKINTIMPKLICLYEDVINENGNESTKHRNKLLEKRYFCGVYKGTAGNEFFWSRVAEYINEIYDTDCLNNVYIAGDGAAWIKGGCEYIENSKFVLDKFHMMKYVNMSVAHLEDSKYDAKNEIWTAINSADKKHLKKVYQIIYDNTENDNKKEEIKRALAYLLNNWAGIKIRVNEAGEIWKCCAEGQVSHVLSDRMSSRPMGWSNHGCDQMAKLLEYKWNGGKIIDLLKHQKEKAKKETKKEMYKLAKEIKTHHSSYNCTEINSITIPGLERKSMKGLKTIINQKLYAKIS